MFTADRSLISFVIKTEKLYLLISIGPYVLAPKITLASAFFLRSAYRAQQPLGKRCGPEFKLTFVYET